MEIVKLSITALRQRLVLNNIVTEDAVRKIGLMYGISLTGIDFLSLLGTIAFMQGGMLLATLDFLVALILVIILFLLYFKGYLSFCIYSGITVLYFLYLYLFISGGISGTAFLWSYTFPLVAMFLLGSKKGFFISFFYFLSCLTVIIVDFNSSLINLYNKDVSLRFTTSFAVVILFSLIYEKFREKSQWALLESRNSLEDKVLERTHGLENEIQKRKQIEKELRYSENRFRNLVESAADAIFVFDERGKFEVVNAQSCISLGYTENELLQLSVATIDDEFTETDVLKVLSGGSGKEWPLTTTGRHKRKDGTVFPVEIRIDTLETNKGRHFVALARDISERMRTEDQIRALNHLREELLGLGDLEKKLTCVTEAVVNIFDADFCRIWVINPGDLCHSDCPHARVTEGPHVCRDRDRCLHLAASSGRYAGLDSKMHSRVPFGCYKIGRVASGDIPGFNTNDVTHDPRIHDQEWARQLGLVSFTGYRLFSESGAPLGVLALFSKHIIGPHEVGLLEGVANNISQIVQVTMAEEEKEKIQTQLIRAQKMEAIGLMAGGVAHDLNNILAGIVGYPELLLLQLPQASELRKPIKAILESGERATTVVADLLTVARGAASTREAHNIHTLINEYLDSPEYEVLKSSNPEVICTKQLNAKQPTISCSPVHIKKTLMNLMINAMEAIGDKGNIVVSTGNQLIAESDMLELNMEPGTYVSLIIRDDGPGISANDLEHIFEPFYSKKIMGHSGTGLGLTIVWNTVMDHNGKVFIDSNENGTSFQLYFPVSDREIVRAENETGEQNGGNNEHILVVDDEPQLRDIASQMLQTMGYVVDSVSSGELALEFVKKKTVDLIILDMLMEPGMSGRQTYEEITKLHPKQKAIVASGFSESEDVKATLRLGAGGFIKKPYSMTKLGQVVKEVLHS